MVQYTCWQCHCAVPNSFIVTLAENTASFVCSLPLCCAMTDSSLPSFSPFHPSLPSYLLSFCIMCHSSLPSHHSYSYSVLQFHRINMWTTGAFFYNISPSRCFCLSSLPSFSPSLPLTVDSSLGQCRQCFGHTEAAGWEKRSLIAGMSITKNNKDSMVQ